MILIFVIIIGVIIGLIVFPGDDFTTANDFRSVGLVVDPTNYGTTTVATATTRRQTYVVKVDTNSGTFEADEVITQASTGAVGKVVEWDSTLSLLYYQQESYKGYGTNATSGGYVAFSGTNTITGATQKARGGWQGSDFYLVMFTSYVPLCMYFYC